MDATHIIFMFSTIDTILNKLRRRLRKVKPIICTPLFDNQNRTCLRRLFSDECHTVVRWLTGWGIQTTRTGTNYLSVAGQHTLLLVCTRRGLVSSVYTRPCSCLLLIPSAFRLNPLCPTYSSVIDFFGKSATCIYSPGNTACVENNHVL